MVTFFNNEPSSGQQGHSYIRTQNHPLPQGRPNRNCQICGDMASGFNLNVPRYISEVLATIRRQPYLTSTKVIVYLALRKGQLNTEIIR